MIHATEPDSSRDRTTDSIENLVRALVDQAPTLTDEQRDRLAILFTPAPSVRATEHLGVVGLPIDVTRASR